MSRVSPQVSGTFRHGGAEGRYEAPQEPTLYGMHGAVADHYGAEPGQFPSHASTIDHLVGVALG